MMFIHTPINNRVFSRSIHSFRRPALLAIALLFCHSSMAADNITVCASGCDYTDIVLAVDAAQSGQTVHIRSGLYTVPWSSSEIISVNQKNLTIRGDGASQTVIQFAEGGGITRRTTGLALNCDSAKEIIIANLTLTSLGVSTGIGNNGCDVKVKNSIIQNQANSGIYNNGAMLIVSSAITHNHTTGRFGNGAGAGIFNNSQGTLTIRDSIIKNNTGGNDGGGGIANIGGAVTLLNSVVSGNTSMGGVGGGLFNDSGSILVKFSLISANNTAYAGARNTYSGFNRGAGIFISGGEVTLKDSIVDHNILAESCAEFSCASLNYLGFGGGIYTATGATLSLIRSVVSDNQTFPDGSGGGLYSAEGSQVTAKNSLIMNNLNSYIIDNCRGPGYTC